MIQCPECGTKLISFGEKHRCSPQAISVTQATPVNISPATVTNVTKDVTNTVTSSGYDKGYADGYKAGYADSLKKAKSTVPNPTVNGTAIPKRDRAEYMKGWRLMDKERKAIKPSP